MNNPISVNSGTNNIELGGLMQSDTSLPYGVYPDVLMTSTITYLAYRNSNGMCVYTFPNNNPSQAKLILQEAEPVSLGFARLFNYKGKILVAYVIDSNPSRVAIYDITRLNYPSIYDITSIPKLIYTSGACVGNYPHCFGENYLFYQLKDVGVKKVNLDDFSESDGPGHYEPTGLAYYDGTNVIGMDENRNSVQGCFNPMHSKSGVGLVGEGVNGGLFTAIGLKTGIINPKQTNNNPQCDSDSNGNLTVVYWNPPEISNVFTILYNITANDIPDTPIISIPTPPSKIKQRWVGSFFNRSLRYGDNPNRIGNVTIIADEAYPIENLAEPLIVTHSVGDAKIITNQDKVIAYYSAAGNFIDLQHDYESYLSLPEKPIIAYIDGRSWPSIMPSYFKQNKTWLGVQAYPSNQESPNSFQNSIEAILDVISKWGLPIILVTCEYDRNSTLTVDQIKAVQYCYNLWYDKYNVIGELAFADRRPSGLITYPQLLPFLNTRFDDTIRPTRNMYWSMDNDWRRNYLTALQNGDVLVKQGSQESLYTISLIKNNLGV
jgi:hypothetical protein